MKIFYARTAYVLNTGSENLDLIQNKLNTEATGKDSAYVEWEEIVSRLDEYHENPRLSKTDKKLVKILEPVYQKIRGEIGSVCFIK